MLVKHVKDSIDYLFEKSRNKKNEIAVFIDAPPSHIGFKNLIKDLKPSDTIEIKEIFNGIVSLCAKDKNNELFNENEWMYYLVEQNYQTSEVNKFFHNGYIAKIIKIVDNLIVQLENDYSDKCVIVNGIEIFHIKGDLKEMYSSEFKHVICVFPFQCAILNDDDIGRRINPYFYFSKATMSLKVIYLN